jgi:hypothetical protein
MVREGGWVFNCWDAQTEALFSHFMAVLRRCGGRRARRSRRGCTKELEVIHLCFLRALLLSALTEHFETSAALLTSPKSVENCVGSLPTRQLNQKWYFFFELHASCSSVRPSLASHSQAGSIVGIKLKRVDFSLTTRSLSVHKPVHALEDIERLSHTLAPSPSSMPALCPSPQLHLSQASTLASRF